MAIFKCKMCGGTLDVNENIAVAECEYCGSKQTIPTKKDEVIANLFNRANNLRLKSEFDRAAEVYNSILNEDDSDAEAHWGLVLCKYGIEYVEDPKTHTRIPTCHRTQYTSVLSDADYLAAIENADLESKSLYTSEAHAIAELQKSILAIVKDEKPFDVFICYKETDENGKRTVDSALANDIYYQLTKEGLRVFYAAITLEDKLGVEYEPYIFAALNSAKVMLVIGTKPEYFNAVWVKNEWSRYLGIMKLDREKILIPCYRDIDAYDLPGEFAHFQALDMSKIGFVNDLVRGIMKVVVKEEAKPTVVNEPVVAVGGANVTALLKRVFMFLEDADWKSANEYCEKVLDIDPECADAYLGKLMISLKVRKREEFKNCAYSFESDNYYKKTLRFADDKLKKELQDCIEYIVYRNSKAVYDEALNVLNSATEINLLMNAQKQFESISTFMDAADKAVCCGKRIEELLEQKRLLAEEKRLRKQYDDLVNVMNVALTSIELEDTAQAFALMVPYRDSEEKAKLCAEMAAEKRLEEEKRRIAKEKAKLKEEKRIAEKQKRLEEEKRIAEEKAKLEEEKRKKRNKIIAILTVLVCVIGISLYVVTTSVIIPNKKYDEAVALMNDGKIIEAYDALVALDGYKDSAEKAESIYQEYSMIKLKQAQAGEYVTFGEYEQDGDTSNGKEEIEWLVLEKQDDRLLVISKYALDRKPFNEKQVDTTWEKCTLRTWLNNDFINSAFTEEEKVLIPTVTVPADKNPGFDTKPGNPTKDKVFVLSVKESDKYFKTDEERAVEATNELWLNVEGEIPSDARCHYWIRTAGPQQDVNAFVFVSGTLVGSGDFVITYPDGTQLVGMDVSNEFVCVRPAMWIDVK